MPSKYKDPASVTCPESAARSSQRVANLLALRATCPNCGNSLMQIGLSMRNGLDEWATYVAILLMTIRLEDRLEMRFTDDEVDGVKTLRDFATIVASHLGNKDEATSRSVELTRWAAGELAEDPFWAGRRPTVGTDQLDFDVPLLDALEPDRWKGPSDGSSA
jgi:hypothetical protein